MANRTGQGTNVPEISSVTPVSGGTISVRNATTSAAATNAGQAWEQVAHAVHRVSSRMEDRLDKIAVDEGAAEGVRRGMRENVQLRRDGTLRGRAFDQSAVRTMSARQDTESRIAADEIYQKHKDNPAQLQTMLKAHMDGIQASDLPDEVKGEVKLSMDRVTAAYMSDATRLAESRQRDADRATSLSAIDARRKSIERLSRLAENDEQAAAQLAAEINDLKNFALKRGPKGAFVFDGVEYPADPTRADIYSLEDVQKLVMGTADAAKEGRIVGKFLQMDSLAEKQVFLQKFDEEFADGKNDLDLEQYDRLAGRMRADIGRMESDARGAVALVGKEAAALESMVEKGFNPGEERLAQLESQALLTGDADAIAAVRQVKGLSTFQNEARAWRPDQLQQWVNAEYTRLNAVDENGQTYQVSEGEIERLNLAEKLLGNMSTELARDPLSWANRVGMAQVAPLNVADPQSFKERHKAALQVSAAYDTPMQLMTDEETLQWKNAWDVAPPDAKVAMIATIQDGFGTDAIHAFADLAKVSPGLANVGALLTMTPAHAETARDFAIGDAALAAGEKIIPQGMKVTTKQQEVIGDAYGDAFGAMTGVKEVADRLYVAAALRKGLTADSFDEDLYEQSLQRAAGAWTDRRGVRYGGIVEQKGGHKIVLPPTMTEDQFQTLIEQMDETDMVKASVGRGGPKHGTGQLLSVKDFRRTYLISSGPGRYVVSLTNPRVRKPVYLLGTGENNYYEIDITQLKEKKP